MYCKSWVGPRVRPNFNDNKWKFKVKHRMQMMQEPNTQSLIFFLSSYYCSFLLLLCLHPFVIASFPSFTLSIFVKLRSVGLPCRSGVERPVNSGLPNKNPHNTSTNLDYDSVLTVFQYIWKVSQTACYALPN